jgi:hypothetical protein
MPSTRRHSSVVDGRLPFASPSHNVGRRRSGMLTRSASKKATPYPKNTAVASPPSKTEVTKATVDMVRSPLMEKLSQSTASLANGATTKAGGRSSQSRRKSILKKQSSFDGSTSKLGSSSNTNSSAIHNKTVIFVDDKENAVSSHEDDVYTVDHSTVVVTTSRSLKKQLFSPIVPKVLSRLDTTTKDETEELPTVTVQEVVVVLDDGTYDENDSQAPVLILDDEPYHMNESASATATVGHDESMMTLQDDDDDDEEGEGSSQEEAVGSSWTNWNLEDMVDTVSPAVGHSPTTTTDNEDHVMGDEDHIVTTSPWYVSTILLALVFFVAPFVMGPSVAAVPAQSFDAMVPAWLAMEQPPVCAEVVPTPEPVLASLKQKTLDAMEQKWNAPPDWLAAEQYAY